MEMPHRLLGAGPVRLDQIQSHRRQRLVDRPRDSDDRARDGGKRLVADVEERGVVFLRQNKTMPVISRIDIHYGECVVVLQKPKTWHLPGNDFAEDAVGIGFHLSFHVLEP